MGLEERQQTREIDGVVYRVTPLPFGTGRPALMRLLKVMAPVLSAALAEPTNANAALLAALPTALSDDDLAWFARIFGDASQYQDGSRWVPLIQQNQELHFAARYEAFFRWLLFCVEVNFGGFFGGIKTASDVVDLVTLATAPSASKASTSGSG